MHLWGNHASRRWFHSHLSPSEKTVFIGDRRWAKPGSSDYNTPSYHLKDTDVQPAWGIQKLIIIIIKITSWSGPFLWAFFLFFITVTFLRKILHRSFGSAGANWSANNCTFQWFVITGAFNACFRLFRWRLFRLYDKDNKALLKARLKFLETWAVS